MAETENFYQDLVDHQQDFVVRFSPEGRLLFVNPAYCDSVGKSKEDLIGSVFMPVTGERYSDVIATQMVKLFRPPFSCTVEQWIQTPKGLRCISWSAKSVVGDGNSVLSIVATGRDITQIRHELKAIKKKDEELMLVVESGERMYYSHSPDHVLTYVSPRIRSVLGSPQRSGKRAWTDFLTDNPMNAAGLERTIRAITSGRREPPYRLEMVKGNGDIIRVEVNEIPVVKNGKTIAIVGSMVDVTEKIQVEEGLAEAEFLIRDYKGGKKHTGTPVYRSSAHAKGPLGYFRAIFSRETGEKEDE
ncbi:MAG TPA: PAS domain-containing protein [Methanoregula sp.]|nr:PAS domain-containing protein [Methanoregula sp.]